MALSYTRVSVSVSEMNKSDLILSTTLLDFFPIIKMNNLFHSNNGAGQEVVRASPAIRGGLSFK